MPVDDYGGRRLIRLHYNHHNNHRFTAIIHNIQVYLRWPAPPVKNLEDFVGAKVYCPHALADGNQRFRIRDKTLEFSATVSSTLSL